MVSVRQCLFFCKFRGEKMFFSVIVPVYNVELYLRECLDSLVGQTCRDMEIILVDDGSTDSSGAVCDEYAAKYPYITVTHQENQGLSGARNTGMSMASGEWISFVDSDDWTDPDMLEILQGHILASGADLYRLGYTVVDESGDYRSTYSMAGNDTVFSIPDERGRFRYFFEEITRTARVWGGAFRRSIIEEHNLCFVDTNLIYSEDLLFSFQFILHAQKIVYVHNLPYHYRKREGSLTDITGFEKRIPRVAVLGGMAYQTVVEEQLSYFQSKFYLLYFRIMNRFIIRDGAKLSNAEIRKVLDDIETADPFYRECIRQIQKDDSALRKYTRGRAWYEKNFGKPDFWETKERSRFIWRAWFFSQNIRSIRKGTTDFPPIFFRDNEQHVAYLSNPKAACSSISASMLRREDIPDDYSVFVLRRPYCSEDPVTEEGWFTFTFVRNPFVRLVSCYESKFHTDQKTNRRAMERRALDFDHYLRGYLKRDQGFAEFVDQVVSIPWRLDNKHFCSQYHRIIGKDGKPMVDFIGKVEHLGEDYEPIREKYDFAPLKVYNKSEHGDWRDYYTTALAKKVYRKYKKDVQYFGYEQEYKDLLAYCAQKER